MLCLRHVYHMRAQRPSSFAAREAHAKRARSRCAAASTGQAPTPCTRTHQIQRGHSFPCKTHAPWLHVPPMECMGSMKRDLAFWTCHTRTPRSSGRVTAAVGGLQDAPSCSTYRAQGMQGQQGGHRSISRIKHDLHRKNAQSAHSPAKPACGSRAQRLPRRAHVSRTGRAGHTCLGTRPSVGGGRCPE